MRRAPDYRNHTRMFLSCGAARNPPQARHRWRSSARRGATSWPSGRAGQQTARGSRRVASTRARFPTCLECLGLQESSLTAAPHRAVLSVRCRSGGPKGARRLSSAGRGAPPARRRLSSCSRGSSATFLSSGISRRGAARASQRARRARSRSRRRRPRTACSPASRGRCARDGAARHGTARPDARLPPFVTPGGSTSRAASGSLAGGPEGVRPGGDPGALLAAAAR